MSSRVYFVLCVVWAAQAALGASGRAKVFAVATDAATVGRLKAAVAYVMSLPEDEMLRIVPEQSGIYFTDCPNCQEGTQDRGPFEWRPQEPTRLTCKGCGEVYPGNEKYPDQGVLEVAAPGGTHPYPYYERASDGYRIFFRAHADYWAREYMATRCRSLGELYAATGDEAAARRAALILLRFADVYPGYAHHYDYPFREKKFSPWNRNRVGGVGAFRTAKWSWWAYMGVSTDLVKAYDCLRGWAGLDQIEQGAAAKIEDDLLGAMVEFVRGFTEPYSNMSPGMWRSVIEAGRVLERPEYVADMVGRLRQFTRDRFLHDGHWAETSPSYCNQVYGALGSVVDALEGYRFPVDAGGAGDEAAALEEARAAIGDLLRSLDAPRLPDGRLLPVNDTWARSNRRRARDEMTPVLLPGLGVAVMGGGEGKEQLHVHLNFTSGRGHKQRDALSLGLFAFGRELLPDIGYTHTRYRQWGISTMAHNTVVVNGRESGYDPEHTENQLLAFCSDGRSFHFAEAESRSAYAEVTTRYRRSVVVVGAESRGAYVVDVFQVRGGAQHDYLLHGSADEASEARLAGVEPAACSGSLMNPGVEFREPRGESDSIGAERAYGFVRDLTSCEAPSLADLTFGIEGEAETGSRSLLFAEPGTTLYLGRAPSIRPARENDALLDRFLSPFLCARRQGEDLVSVFVAVHEAFQGQPSIAEASLSRTDDGIVLEIVKRDGGKDIVLLALEERADMSFADGEFDGRCGLVRIRQGRVSELLLVGGPSLRCGDLSVSCPPGKRLPVAAVVRQREGESRGYFEIDGEIAGGGELFLRALVVLHPDATRHAYSAVRVEAVETRTRVHVLEDPALVFAADGSTEIVCHPQRTMSGQAHTAELLNVVRVAR